jgi:hypothetical protein
MSAIAFDNKATKSLASRLKLLEAQHSREVARLLQLFAGSLGQPPSGVADL